jgi:hypothetical protein
MNKLKINTKAKVNSEDYYLNHPAVLEDYIGNRLIANVSLRAVYSVAKVKTINSLVIEFGNTDKVGDYPLDDDTSLDFDSKQDHVRFTSRGTQYKIRALQDSDKELIEQAQTENSAKQEDEG